MKVKFFELEKKDAKGKSYFVEMIELDHEIKDRSAPPQKSVVPASQKNKEEYSAEYKAFLASKKPTKEKKEGKDV